MGDKASQRMKLLEDLHNKKMQLQSKVDNPSNGAPVIQKMEEPLERTPAESNRLHTGKQVALQQSNTQSDGFFITQDSNFGNLIMSVIPRFNPDGTLAAGNKPRTL
ncbi:SOSS complex subunit C-like [Bolinopsis microptera]|uniref:SOSS complex subunit C-like n=1 Tax=Bolinopsis microptera TaxID=2820187 RepID=UPI00307A5FC2